MMKKDKWVYFAFGAVAIALFFAYKKRNVPAPSKETPSEDEKQFVGMNGKIYVKPQNLIPDVYGRYRGTYLNANGLPCRHTDVEDVYTMCKCTSKAKVPPTILANFR